MESLEAYFQRSDTPMAKSPTGIAMTALLAMAATIEFEEARAAVNHVGASLYTQVECARTALKAIRAQKMAA